MRKTLTILLAASLVLGALLAPAADAKKKKKKKPKKVTRTVGHEYAAPSPGVAGLAGACLQDQMENAGCFEIPLGVADKFVSVAIVDSSGRQVAGTMSQDTDPSDTGYEIIATFCGKTEKPVPVTAGLALRISAYAVSTGACPGVATRGTITAKISNLP